MAYERFNAAQVERELSRLVHMNVITSYRRAPSPAAAWFLHIPGRGRVRWTIGTVDAFLSGVAVALNHQEVGS